jgi:hypothetical protein
VAPVRPKGQLFPVRGVRLVGRGVRRCVWPRHLAGRPVVQLQHNASFRGNDLGGFWGWVEFDRLSKGTITGDAEFAGCGHSVGGGGPGSAGAGHIRIDITAAHIGPPGPDDPPGVSAVFYVDHNVVTFIGHGGSQTVTDDPDFLGDTGIPVDPGNSSFHPAPGVADVITVSFRPAK